MSTTNAQVSIITIGDELLIGQVVDTNSAWMAQELNKQGFWVRKRVSVGDSYAEMRAAFDEESAHSQIILVTGGLGPTADDITKPFLCEYFNTRLVINDSVLAHVRHLFEEVYRRPVIERNLKQAEVPENCTVIPNARGTAPGMMFEKNKVVYVSMPGVPHEMKGMMTDHVLPLLKKKVSTGNILHRTLLTVGIGESFLAEHIAGWESSLPPYIKLAYLPNYGMVRLRLTATGSNVDILGRELDKEFNVLKDLVAQWLAIDEDLSMPQIVSRLLRNRKKTLATAESCTGGFIAHQLTREPGASAVFVGSVISYANDIKQSILGVSAATLETNGAVSEETVTAMAQGALGVTGANYVIATSGIMGPDGGSPSKPVGTVWIAVASEKSTVARKLQLRFDRNRNIEMTAVHALDLLRRFINEEDHQPG